MNQELLSAQSTTGDPSAATDIATPTPTPTISEQAVQKASWKDYLELCKPKVVLLMLITQWVGILLAPVSASFMLISCSLLGVGLSAGAAAAFNHLADYRIDAQMNRTKKRPLVKKSLAAHQVLIFASLLGFTGLTLLWLTVNPLTSILTFFSLIGYALVYTLYLKRATPQNIVIGGLAGAAPPLLGWSSVTNSIDGGALLLVLIIFTWTPPHFWALAIYRKDEYAKAGVPMLPVTHGVPYTKLMLLLYTLLLVPISLLPWLSGMSGLLYLSGAVPLVLHYLYSSWKLFKETNPLEERKQAIKSFRYSIIWLFAIFILLIGDRML